MAYSVCTQEQIRYSCGHEKDGEFIKCATHASTDSRCSSNTIQYKTVRSSTHSCRTCSNSK
ncbi:hypothetical protein DM02DRAFT_615674 [Periconia macrospinosa]|uniref:Uncharacterized protein n=1 Tax=Periconia macrospinosa TaxID=97972 RepID=A0A2V1DND0_9PLEO|nr:hypothetical protein DM02DRAFT_615674 [Periconia macrospinosa]